MLLKVRNLSLRVDILLLIIASVIIVCISNSELLLWCKLSKIAHLSHELNRSFQTEGSVSDIRIKMQLSRHPHLAQLPVNQCGSSGSIWIFAAMVKGHRTCQGIELEDIIKSDIDSISLTLRACSLIRICSSVCRCIQKCPIDMTRELIKLINRLISRGLRTCRKKKSHVGTCGHCRNTYLLRIKSPFLCLRPYKSHCSLTILPSCLINRKTNGARGSIYQCNTLKTQLSKSLSPFFHQLYITPVLIAAS